MWDKTATVSDSTCPRSSTTTITIEDMAISSMWETSALVEVLELRHVESGTVAVLSHI